MGFPVTIRLRHARQADARLLWRWANDRTTRRGSYHSGAIPWTVHTHWFRGKLSSRDHTRIYVAESLDGVALAQVRFDRAAPGRAEIHISVAPRVRRRGVGRRVIELGCRRARRELAVRQIRAYVKEENAASLSVFRAAGFRRVRRVSRYGAHSVLLSYRSPSSGRRL